jgi:tetratricopeptide (TPR) repeat protein
MIHRRCGILLALLAFVHACAPVPGDLPPIEPWGDIDKPYGDSLEAAAVRAFGPMPPAHQRGAPHASAVALEDVFLDANEQRERTAIAAGLVYSSTLARKFSGSDSLPLLLEALHVAPHFVPSYEDAARVLGDRGAWERAHAIARQGLRLDPGNASLWGTLAGAYLYALDDTRAAAALEQANAIDSNPQQVEALALVYVRLHKPEQADSLLNAAPEGIKPSTRDFVAGQWLLERGEVDSARALIQRAANDSTAPAAIHIASGNAAFQAGDLDVAERAFRAALARDPDARAALNGLAIVHRGRGDLEGAAELLVRVTQVAPADTIAQFNLAGVSLDLAQRSGASADSFAAIAETAFGACIAANYRTADSLERRARLRLRRQDFSGAEADATLLAAIPGERLPANLLRARAALGLGNPRRAIAALEPECASESAPLEALELLGTAYSEVDAYDRAATVLRRVQAKRPLDWRVAVNLGVALSESGDLAGAESVLRAVAEARPNDPIVLQNLAAVLQRLGKRREADQLLQRVQRLQHP